MVSKRSGDSIVVSNSKTLCLPEHDLESKYTVDWSDVTSSVGSEHRDPFGVDVRYL